MGIKVLNKYIHISYDVQLDLLKLHIYEIGNDILKKIIAIPKGDDSMIKLAQLLPILYDKGVVIKDINEGTGFDVNDDNFTLMLVEYGAYNVISILHNDDCDLVILIQEDV